MVVGLKLGLDTGGTYTDAVILGDDGHVVACAKSLTTHRDLVQGLRGAVDQVTSDCDVADIRLVCLSTTLATNALVEGRGRPVALLLMGLTQAQLQRANLSDALGSDPLLLTRGGHDANGQALAELDEAEIREFVEQVNPSVEAFAVSAVFAVRNPAHENRVQALIESMTDKPVSCGHQLSAGLDAPRRALTALLNARLIPMINALLMAARTLLQENSIEAPLMVVKGDGSLISERVASQCPVETILSGPAASVVGAQYLCDSPDLLVSDMGGTTTDIALISQGQPRLSADGATVGGWRTMVNAIDVTTFGLGGDSEVVFDRGARDFSISTQRVMSLSSLIDQYPACLSELQAQLESDYASTHDAQFVMAHAAMPTDLSHQQQLLYDQVTVKPIALRTLFRDQTLERALRRLEQRGIVLRAGFTPTDASHCLGTQSTWSAAAAMLGARLLMRYSEQNLGRKYASEQLLAEQICAEVSHLSALACIESVSKSEGRPVTASQRELFDYGLRLQAGQSLSVSARLHLPLVALGAPAASYLRHSAALLQTEVQTPGYAHVANALGAVVGSVRQQHVMLINPAGGKRVAVMMTDGPVECRTLDEGAALAIAEATRLASLKAKAAGAEALVTEVQRCDNTVQEGNEIVFFGSEITVTASGRPALG